MQATAGVRSPPTWRALFTLAWPIIVSRSTQSVVGLTDALMVAELGAAALAATTAGAMNTFVALILPMGTVFIISTFSAQLLGANDLPGARRYGWYGLGLSAVAQLLSLLFLAVLPQVLRVLPYAPDVQHLMREYLQIRLLGAGAAIGVEALANYYGGLGNTVRPMVANVAAMVLNVTGNYLLIHGRWGFPALGVRGAALASALASSVAFLGLFVGFVREGRPRGLSLREFGRMLRFGLPSGFNWFFEFFAFIWFVNVVVAGLGTSAVAALMTVMQINSVSFMPAFGLASAGAILVGQAIGAKALEDVPVAVRRTLTSTLSWQGLVGLSYLVAPALLMLPFLSEREDSRELLRLGVQMLMLSAAWQLFDATVNTLGEALRGAGDTAVVLWGRILVAWAVFVPGSWLTVRHFGGGLLAASSWVVVYLGVLAVFLSYRFLSGAWRRIQLLEADAPPAP